MNTFKHNSEKVFICQRVYTCKRPCQHGKPHKTNTYKDTCSEFECPRINGRKAFCIETDKVSELLVKEGMPE